MFNNFKVVCLWRTCLIQNIWIIHWKCSRIYHNVRFKLIIGTLDKWKSKSCLKNTSSSIPIFPVLDWPGGSWSGLVNLLILSICVMFLATSFMSLFIVVYSVVLVYSGEWRFPHFEQRSSRIWGDENYFQVLSTFYRIYLFLRLNIWTLEGSGGRARVAGIRLRQELGLCLPRW